VVQSSTPTRTLQSYVATLVSRLKEHTVECSCCEPGNKSREVNCRPNRIYVGDDRNCHDYSYVTAVGQTPSVHVDGLIYSIGYVI
jgi:hypothetical protein